jgi:hypothetical protein
MHRDQKLCSGSGLDTLDGIYEIEGCIVAGGHLRDNIGGNDYGIAIPGRSFAAFVAIAYGPIEIRVVDGCLQRKIGTLGARK